MIIIIILLIIIILSLLLYYKTNKQKLEEKIKQNYINTNKKELENNLLIEFNNRREQANLEHKLRLAELEKEEDRLEAIIKTSEETIRILEKSKEKQIKLIKETIKDKKKVVDVEVQAYRDLETQKAATALMQWATTARSAEEASLNVYKDEVAQCKQKMQEELAHTQYEIDCIKNELADYKKKQQAVNEAILRQRAIDEQQDFYRVCLSENAIEDIKLLQEIRQKLHTSDNLNKLIYDVYVGKNVQEMVKRVLQGGALSGIYKITRLKTGEIYIGKSTNVKDRWIQHCKTVYGAGTIAHSILHTTMAKDGLENFTFELVEKVPKDKLTEREKYWINFYGSRDYGLNERCG